MATPKNLELIPRELKMNFTEILQQNRYYVDNDPVKSHLWSALQCLFPEGERFFIDSARDVREKMKGELPADLEKQIKTFIHQEAHHGALHEEMNKALVALRYSRIAEYSEWLKEIRTESRKRVPALTRLAITAAGEHFTAVIARLHLHDDPQFFNSLDPNAQPLFLYHAMEEIEHKAVCYDLYQAAGGGYLRRVLSLYGFLFGLTIQLRKMHIYMLKKDGLWNKKTKRQAWQEVWGRNGIVRKLMPSILDYMRPDFHPWNHDDRVWFENKFDKQLESFNLPGYSLT